MLIAQLEPEARKEAIRLGLDRNHRALKYAASSRGSTLQILSLQNEARVRENRLRRKLAAPVAGPATPAATTTVVVTDQHVADAQRFYLWLVSECGAKAATIVWALDGIDLPILKKIVREIDPDEVARISTGQTRLH